MQDLQLIGVHEDGEHLLLKGADNERFQMPVDDALRAAVRRDRPRLGRQQSEAEGGLRPRDVQALIRAGASADETAVRAGWPVEKVHRYEGPILAEREHVAGLAQQARLRSRSGASPAKVPTLSERVSERLGARDVEVSEADWDSWRSEGGPWTVVLTFAAGGRQRQASWTFNLADKTVSAVDDEARWLSEEEQDANGPIPAPRLRTTSHQDSTVYDVEAEGGLRASGRDEHPDDPLDLMTAMRKRSTARGRRKPASRSGSSRAARSSTDVPRTDRDAQQQGPSLEDPEDGGFEPETPQAPERRPHPADPAAALIDLDEADLIEDEEPRETSQPVADAIPDPAEKASRQGKSKARPKRPVREAGRKTGRPSVPAWDEIMFGSRSGGDRSSS
jgi:hypothetical protein